MSYVDAWGNNILLQVHDPDQWQILSVHACCISVQFPISWCQVYARARVCVCVFRVIKIQGNCRGSSVIKSNSLNNNKTRRGNTCSVIHLHCTRAYSASLPHIHTAPTGPANHGKTLMHFTRDDLKSFTYPNECSGVFERLSVPVKGILGDVPFGRTVPVWFTLFTADY